MAILFGIIIAIIIERNRVTVVVQRDDSLAKPAVDPGNAPISAAKRPVVKAPTDQLQSAEPRWEPLFNGRDLTGWVFDGGEKTGWEWKNGELVMHAVEKDNLDHLGYLLSEQEYTDFRLRFEFQPSSRAESGVAFRAVPHETARNLKVTHHHDMPFHLTVWIGQAGTRDLTGAVWCSPFGDLTEQWLPNHRAQLKPSGEWNAMVIEIRGQSLRVAVNGDENQNIPLNRDRPMKIPPPGLGRFEGRVGFLNRTGEVRFRNVEITELGTAATKVVRAKNPPARPREVFKNSVGIELRLIPNGEFLMGSPRDDKDAGDSEKPPHPVRITRSFYLGVTEVTRGQFSRFVDATGYQTDAEKDGKGGGGWNHETKKLEANARFTWRNAGFEQTNEHPAVNLSWNDAQAYIAWLSRKEGKRYRLPTEAEWEYSCRAGTKSRYACGADPEGLAAVGNVADRAARAIFPDFWWAIAASDGFAHTAPVGGFRQNSFGLHDMHGNVWEWCSDGYDPNYYKRSPRDDPQGDPGASRRVIRGGGWFNRPSTCRSAERGPWFAPSDRSFDVGFRLAMDAPDDESVSADAGSRRSSLNSDNGNNQDPPPPVSDDVDRRAATAALSLRGTVKIRVNGQEQRIEPGKSLPKDALELTHVQLGDQPELTDAGLVPFAGLTNLVDLRLSKSPKITDVGFAHLRNLPRLTGLSLDGTGITDEGLANLKDLTTLSALNLGNTAVTDRGLAHLEGLTRLVFLSLEGLRVSGAGLMHLRRLEQLDTLWLMRTSLTDAGLENVRSLTKLRHLALWGTQVTDLGLVHLRSLSLLEGLMLGGTHVSENGLASLGSLSQLKHLWLDGTRVTDSGLAQLEGLTGLKELDLNGTGVTDVGLGRLQKLPQLELLRLNGTRVSDAGLALIGPLPKLRSLWLDGTRVSDAGLKHLKDATQLKELRLNRTSLTNDGIMQLQHLTQLEEIQSQGTNVTVTGAGEAQEKDSSVPDRDRSCWNDRSRKTAGELGREFLRRFWAGNRGWPSTPGLGHEFQRKSVQPYG